jgi:hypoxanthine phosphoribosyltransferase
MSFKRYISPQELLESSYKLADKILESGFHPKFIVGIWRGGAPIGIAVQEYFKYFGYTSDHISIRTSSYTGTGEGAQQTHDIRVHGLEYIVERANAGDSLLLVDDIFDSGRSVKAVISELSHKMRLNLPQDIRVATVLYKPKNNKTDIMPQYYVEETDMWIVFPHELEDMSVEEIKSSKGDVIGDLIANRLQKTEP